MIARRREASRYLAQQWQKAFLAGLALWGSYGLALWAMTQAPLAVVAALRETSILFALTARCCLKRKWPLRSGGGWRDCPQAILPVCHVIAQ